MYGVGVMCSIDLAVSSHKVSRAVVGRSCDPPSALALVDSGCSGALARLAYLAGSCRVVFDTLYLLLSFGHDTPEEAEKLDPPFSYFRIRLICSLLETCGQFFNKGLAKKRLDRFLTFFQRYLLAKPPLPLDVEFDVQVCISSCIFVHISAYQQGFI